MQGLDEAIFRNIEACKELTNITKSSYGPNGNELLIDTQIIQLQIWTLPEFTSMPTKQLASSQGWK